MSQPERTYYHGKRAHVTSTCAVIDGKAYDIADITAARVRFEQPGILLPVLMVSFGIPLVIADQLSGQGTVSMVLLVLSVIWAAIGMPMIVLDKGKYVVLLVGADGEVPVLSSADEAVVDEIVNAIRRVLIAEEP